MHNFSIICILPELLKSACTVVTEKAMVDYRVVLSALLPNTWGRERA